MSTLLIVIVIFVSGAGGVLSSLILRHRRAAIVQVALALLAAAMVGLVASSNDFATVVALAGVSWTLHLATTYGVVKDGRRDKIVA